MKHEILLQNQYIIADKKSKENTNNQTALGTIFSNMTYYGYAPSKELVEVLKTYSSKDLEKFWEVIEPTFKKITGDDKQMDKYVVYKNFPKEVLDMDHATYWVKQILMYVGFDNQLFTQEEKPRAAHFDSLKLKTINSIASNQVDETLQGILKSYQKINKGWTDKQKENMIFLVDTYQTEIIENAKYQKINISDFSFKENAIEFVKTLLDKTKNHPVNSQLTADKLKDVFVFNSATDVLRLASGLSEQDIGLKKNPKFKNFSRKERKLFLSFLEDATNLNDDVAARPELFKRFLHSLHPGDYNFKNVQKVYDALYQDKLTSFNSKVEGLLADNKTEVLDLLVTRPGELLRKFHQIYSKLGQNDEGKTKILDFFEIAMADLTNAQLIKFKKYVENINDTSELLVTPQGSWKKAQIIDNQKVKFSEEFKYSLIQKIEQKIKYRLDVLFPDGIDVDEKLKDNKIQSGQQKLAAYGRGTSFDIPAEMNFLRTASYWQQKSSRSVWFDNGWNFFDSNWNPTQTICWDSTHINNSCAVFSGDPTNSKDMQGKACQMIDIYIDKCLAEGKRYAVWNVLGFSRIKFSDAQDVMATLQWGENAEKGKIYEPNRAQMVFPLKDEDLAKFVAYIDLQERKLVYMDVNLNAKVTSAKSNEKSLSEKMPVFINYLKQQPSVYDLLSVVHNEQSLVKALWSDSGVTLDEDKKHYVFKKENTENQVNLIDLQEILDYSDKEINALKVKTKKSLKRF